MATNISRKKRFARVQKALWHRLALSNNDSDETFYFIIGYTDVGAPYGITWGETENKADQTMKNGLTEDEDENDVMPF